MPAYDYRCTTCEVTFEVRRQASEAAGPCPECGGEVKRVFTPVGMVLKGSGFHNTDYRKQSTETDTSAACDSAGSKKECAACPAVSE